MLVVRVREPATDGRANRAVVAAIAGSLGVGGSAVRIGSGAASRRKTVEVDGDDATLSARWDALLDAG